MRKAKLIPSYELAIKARWEGTTAEGAAGRGLIELPYVADENADEDPELRLVFLDVCMSWAVVRLCMCSCGWLVVWWVGWVKDSRTAAPQDAVFVCSAAACNPHAQTHALLALLQPLLSVLLSLLLLS